jgi:transcriptional regulator NrdR family protein
MSTQEFNPMPAENVRSFKTASGKEIKFLIPLGKRKRRYCPKCKVKFTVCPLEQNKHLVHHYLCSNKCKLPKLGKCPYNETEKVSRETLQPSKINNHPPSCGTIIGKPRHCKSCKHFRKSNKCKLQENLAILKDGRTHPTPTVNPNTKTLINPNMEACEHYKRR